MELELGTLSTLQLGPMVSLDGERIGRGGIER